MLTSRSRPLTPTDSPAAAGAVDALVAAASHAGDGRRPTGVEAPVAGLDADALARLATLDPSGQGRLVERVLKAFQVSADRLLPQLDAAQLSGDLNTIRLVAHTLKSSSASIGALALSQRCARIETATREAATHDLNPASLIDDLDALRLALAAALQAIERLTPGGPA